MKRIYFLITVLLASLITFSQTEGTFGSMMYKAPAGWSEQKFSDGVVFKPLGLASTEHLAIQIMLPLTFSGSMEEALAQSYTEATAMYSATKMNYAGGGSYQKTTVQRSFNGWEYIRGKGGIQVENGTQFKTELGLELFIIKINNRFERVAILESRTNCNWSRYYASDRVSYRSSIESLLFSLLFTDFNGVGLKPGSCKGNGITGIWEGTTQYTGAANRSQLQAFCPIFLTNGQVYFGTKFPTEGLDGIDTRVLQELNNRDWGTYTFSNGKGVMKMPYGNIPIRIDGNKLIITKNQTEWPFYKLSSVDGAVFNGTYALSKDNGKIPSITFTSDGKFTDNGAVKVLYHVYIDCLNPGLTPGSGKYEVKDHSITFHYSDGRNVKIAFMGTGYEKNHPSPDVLRMSYDDNAMTKQ